MEIINGRRVYTGESYISNHSGNSAYIVQSGIFIGGNKMCGNITKYGCLVMINECSLVFWEQEEFLERFTEKQDQLPELEAAQNLPEGGKYER